jgi:hypothetical protein
MLACRRARDLHRGRDEFMADVVAFEDSDFHAVHFTQSKVGYDFAFVAHK